MPDNVRQSIKRLLYETVEETGGESPGELGDDAILLESGLDSLGFAILIAKLDEVVGYDPFSIADEPYYPSTLGEFVQFYETHQPA